MPNRPLIAIAALAVLYAAPSVAAAPAAPTYAITERIAGPDGGWDLLDVDSAGGELYLARSSGLMAVNLATGRVSSDLVKGARGHAALAIPGSHLVLFTSGGDNTATLYDTKTGTVAVTLAVGKNPDAAAYDPVTRTVWVMNPGSGDISVIDPALGRVVATIPVGGSLELAAVDGGGHLFVNIEDTNEVVVLDTRTRKILSRFPLKGCDGPTGIAYAVGPRQVLSACANGVAIVSTPDGRQIASLKIGSRPDGALYDEKRHLAFVPSGGEGVLSVLSLGAHPAVVATIQTAKGARTAALDPVTGRIYLPSARYGEAGAGQRPPMIPGSFSIIVVSPVANQ